jgi:hypothetical protein
MELRCRPLFSRERQNTHRLLARSSRRSFADTLARDFGSIFPIACQLKVLVENEQELRKGNYPKNALLKQKLGYAARSASVKIRRVDRKTQPVDPGQVSCHRKVALKLTLTHPNARKCTEAVVRTSALMFALLLVPALSFAQTNPPINQALRIAPQSQAGSNFQAQCVTVRRIVAADNAAFQCQQADGTVTMIRVGKGYDQTGSYYVGFESATGAGLTVQAVSTFAVLKSQNPGSPAVLAINGVYSKLPNTNAAATALSATLIVN